MTIPSSVLRVLEEINEKLKNDRTVVLLSVDPADIRMLDTFAHEIHQMFWDIGMPQAADIVRNHYVATTGREDVL